MKFPFNLNSIEKPEDLNGALSVGETLTEQELSTIGGGYYDKDDFDENFDDDFIGVDIGLFDREDRDRW